MHERRKAQRFPIEQPVRLKYTFAGHLEIVAVARDVSTQGAFLYVDSEIVKGAEVELLLKLPGESGLIPVKVRGKVVRVEQTPHTGKRGAGITFEKVEILPE